MRKDASLDHNSENSDTIESLRSDDSQII